MKRMIAFVFFICLLLGMAFFRDKFKIENFDFEKLVIVSCFDLDNIETQKVKNGDDFYYYFDRENGYKALKNIDKAQIKGIIYYFSSEFDINYFKNKFNYFISDKSEVTEREVYYGYDKDYLDFKVIDGKKINFQLAFDGENWILGYPMIITGF